jgi:hypothetical protein
MDVAVHAEFEARVRLYRGEKASWHLVTLPQSLADEIRFFHGKGAGWGSVRVEAVIGSSRWKTSIFPQGKGGSYLLLLKAEIRKREQIGEGDDVMITLSTLS